MNIKLLFFFLLTNTIALSQDSVCFKSNIEAKSFAEGYWKVVEDTSAHFYKITFSGDLGKIEFLEAEDLNSNRTDNKYDLVFNQSIELVLEANNNCLEIGQELLISNGSVFRELSFVSKNEFTFLGQSFRRYRPE